MTTAKKVSKIQQLVKTLLLLGPMTYDELAKIAGADSNVVAVMLRNAMKDGKYGIYIKDVAPSKNKNVVKNVMAIDIEKYNQYMKRFEPRAKSQPKPKPKPLPPPKPERNIKLPDTKHRTIWQPSSPYQ